MAVVYNNLKADFIRGKLSVNILFRKKTVMFPLSYRDFIGQLHCCTIQGGSIILCIIHSMKYRKNILTKLCNNLLASQKCSGK